MNRKQQNRANQIAKQARRALRGEGQVLATEVSLDHLQPVLLHIEETLNNEGWDLPHRGFWIIQGRDVPEPIRAEMRNQGAIPHSAEDDAVYLMEIPWTTDGFAKPQDSWIGVEVPTFVCGAVITCEGWHVPNGTELDDLIRPSEHPRRVEHRSVFAMTRSGREIMVTRNRGDEPSVARSDQEVLNFTGHVARTLARLAGAEIPAPKERAGYWMASEGISHMLNLGHDVLQPWERPTNSMLDILASTVSLVARHGEQCDEPEGFEEEAVTDSWEIVYGGFANNAAQPGATGRDLARILWLGVNGLAAELLERSAPMDAVLDRVAREQSPEAANHLRHALECVAYLRPQPATV